MYNVKPQKNKEPKIQSPLVQKMAINNQDINSDWYKAIINSAMEGFSLLNLNVDILDINNAFCQMTDYSHDEFLSMDIKNIDVEFIESPEKFKQKISEVKKAGGDLFEAQHKRKDGRMIDVLVSLQYLDTCNDLFFCFHRYITEHKLKLKQELKNHKQTEEALKESEDRYRAHSIESGGKRWGGIQDPRR